MRKGHEAWLAQPEQLDSSGTDFAALMDLSNQKNSARPAGTELEIRTKQAIVRGTVCQIGAETKFVPQTAAHPSKQDEAMAANLDRTIAASRRGEWFEHAYTTDEDPEGTIINRLRPLADEAKAGGQHFFVAFLGSAFAVMPARRKEIQHDKWLAEKYRGYAGAHNGQNNVTQAIALIDPGEHDQAAASKLSEYTDSTQINVPDDIHPHGQDVYDVDTDAIFHDEVDRTHHAVTFTNREALSWGGSRISSQDYEFTGEPSQTVRLAPAAGATALARPHEPEITF
jgi:hypothetical protein